MSNIVPVTNFLVSDYFNFGRVVCALIEESKLSESIMQFGRLSFTEWLNLSDERTVRQSRMGQYLGYIKHTLNGSDALRAEVLAQMHEVFKDTPSIKKLHDTVIWQTIQPAIVSFDDKVRPLATESSSSATVMEVDKAVEKRAPAISLTDTIRALRCHEKELEEVIRRRDVHIQKMEQEYCVVVKELRQQLHREECAARENGNELSVTRISLYNLQKREEEFNAARNSDKGELVHQVSTLKKDVLRLKAQLERTESLRGDDARMYDGRISQLEAAVSNRTKQVEELERANDALKKELCEARRAQFAATVLPDLHEPSNPKPPITEEEMMKIAKVLCGYGVPHLHFGIVVGTTYDDWSSYCRAHVLGSSEMARNCEYVRYSVMMSGLTAKELGAKLFAYREFNFSACPELAFFREYMR